MLTPIDDADVPEVMRIERLPGYDAFVGRWTAEEHAAERASPDAPYPGWREGGRLKGFVSGGLGAPEHERMILTREAWTALPRRAVP